MSELASSWLAADYIPITSAAGEGIHHDHRVATLLGLEREVCLRLHALDRDGVYCCVHRGEIEARIFAEMALNRGLDAVLVVRSYRSLRARRVAEHGIRWRRNDSSIRRGRLFRFSATSGTRQN